MTSAVKTCVSIACVIGLASCVTTSAIPPEISAAIPRDARAVRIYSDQSAADLYRAVYQSIAARGFAVAQENQQMGTLSTQPKDIGQETTLSITIFVQDTTGGSMATLRGHWGVTAAMAAGLSAGFGASPAGGTADEARWGGMGREKVAFGEVAVIADGIPHTRLVYLSQ